jgi:hypothetical protein
LSNEDWKMGVEAWADATARSRNKMRRIFVPPKFHSSRQRLPA